MAKSSENSFFQDKSHLLPGSAIVVLYWMLINNVVYLI